MRATVVVLDDDSPASLPRVAVPEIEFLGVTLPARVWRDVALGLRDLDRTECDQLQVFRKGRDLKVKTLRII